MKRYSFFSIVFSQLYVLYSKDIFFPRTEIIGEKYSGEQTMNTFLLFLILGFVTILFLFFIFMLFGWRWIIKKMAAKMGKILLSDSYQENILEMIPGFRHVGVQ